MPLLRVKDARDMSPEERADKLDEFRTELVRLKTMISAGGTVENPARVRALRKAIAKILTIDHEERRGMEKTEPAKRKTEPDKKTTELHKRKTEVAKRKKK